MVGTTKPLWSPTRKHLPMEHSAPTAVLVCLVLVASTVVVSAPAGSTGPAATAPAVVTTPPSPTDNTTARLVLPRYRVTESNFETVHIGMASTLQSASDDARLQYRTRAVEREFEAADSLDSKRNVLDRALIDLESRAQGLEAREQAAIRNYSDGNISAYVLVSRLARIHAQSERVTATLDVLRRLSDRVGVDVFDSRMRDVQGRLVTLQGPVRERAARVRAGEASPVRVYAVASEEGLVLSMLVGGRYVREGTYWRNRNASGSPELDFGDIGARVEELYPWVADQQGSTGIIWRGRGVWRFRSTHPQGVLTAYVDSATQDVFRETQTLTVADVPTTMTVVHSGDGLRVTLRRTYVGGPLDIFVENADTDTAINAQVSVEGHEFGHSGADGLVRTIEPRAPYTVNVTRDNVSIEISVERPFDESED